MAKAKTSKKAKTAKRPASAAKKKKPTAKETRFDAKWFDEQMAAQKDRAQDFKKMNDGWQNLWQDWQQKMSSASQPHTAPQGSQYADLFRRMGEPLMQMMAGAANSTTPQDHVQKWMDTQRGFLEMFVLGSETHKKNENPFAAYMEGMTEAAPDFFSQMMKNPAFNLAGHGQRAAFASRAFDPFDLMASLPGIGYTREKQEEWGRLYHSWQKFDDAQRKYQTQMAKIALIALSRFQEDLKKPPSDTTKVMHSLKEIYVRWVDVSEDVYARFAMSEEYTKLYGDVVNAQMNLKKEMNTLTAQWAQNLNLPTRQEVDTLAERVQALRRDNRALREMIETLLLQINNERKAP